MTVRRHMSLTVPALVLVLAFTILTGCGGGNRGPAADGNTGPRPDGFPFPVYADWNMAADSKDGAPRVVIFRFEGDRDAVLQKYAQDLTEMGLSVTVDGFRIIAEGELGEQPVNAQAVFQQAEELIQVTFSLN